MYFLSFSFLWLLFPAAFLLYRLLPEKNPIWRNALLLLVSLVFYSWGQPYVLLLIACVAANYFFGLKISEGPWDGIPRRTNRIWLAIAVMCNLLVLGYFKYLNFVLSTLNGLFGTGFGPTVAGVPVGVSFFTFKSISYLMDVYRRKVPEQRNPVSLGLYISFFPHIMSGPIAQYEEMATQIDGPRQLGIERTAYGVKRFIYGFGKKALIADILGAFVDAIYGMSVVQVPGGWYWLVMVCYTLQLYFDFSGYSDMAIGIGEMFGFSIRENFDLPYLSRSLREFWRHWHMSLNRWFMSYLYIPLGGSRKGRARTMFNLLIVFLVTGIWHGAGLNFIVWGLWHGVFMLLERTAFGKWLDAPRANVPSRIYTLLVVGLGWVMFRAESMTQAMAIFRSMFSFASVQYSMPLALYLRPHTIAALVAGLVLCGPLQALLPGMKRQVDNRERVGLVQTLALLGIFAVGMILTINGTYSSFIYYKF